MDYGMIGKREKAKRYAEERNRFLFNKFDITFHGDNNDSRSCCGGWFQRQLNRKQTIEQNQLPSRKWRAVALRVNS